MASYDNNLIVLGAGSGGLIAALIAATIRARVTLIEPGAMGGDCLNTGCVPSKALIRCAKAAHQVRHAGDFGIRSNAPETDFAAVMAHVHGAIRTIEPKDSRERYTSLGVNCIEDSGRLLDGHRVQVGDQEISARAIVLATGARPFVPPIPGLAEVGALTSDNLWDLKELPPRLLVMGGGPIGCELAQAFARLGSAVTLIDMAPRLLPREDEDAAAHITERFVAEGIDVRTSTRAVGFTKAASGGGVAQVELGDGAAATLAFDQVLVAVGRAPNTAQLGVEDLGLELQPNGAVVVDTYQRTSVPSVFACGDVVGPYQFTHMASHQAWFAAVNALVGCWFKTNYSVVPWATYTDPEIGRVGLSEMDAQEQGIAVEVTRYELDDLDRAIADGSAAGWIKVLTKPGSDKILGASAVGPHGGELIGQFVTAMSQGLGLKRLMSTIQIYPTYNEAPKLAAGAWRRAHAPQTALNLAERFHRWRR